MKKGKAYSHRTGNRIGDLYNTPFSLVWSLLNLESLNNPYDPCAGELAIVKAAAVKGIVIKDSDINSIYNKNPFIKIIDVNNYAKLGNYGKEKNI